MVATNLTLLGVSGASTAADSSFAARIETGLLLMVVGMGVVFAALILIGAMITLLSAVIRRFEESGSAEALEPAPASSGTAYPQAMGADNTGGVDQRTLVLISAAVAAVAGAQARVRRVTRLNQTATVSAWTDAGRYGLHSHNVRR